MTRSLHINFRKGTGLGVKHAAENQGAAMASMSDMECT